MAEKKPTPQQSTPPPRAQPTPISLYPVQKDFLDRRAEELTQQTGVPHTRSSVNQQLIDDARKKKEQGQ